MQGGKFDNRCYSMCGIRFSAGVGISLRRIWERRMSSDQATPSAVFLSYAREDSESARKIAQALRASGIEVWFDEDELRGGDAWDGRETRPVVQDNGLPLARQLAGERVASLGMSSEFGVLSLHAAKGGRG
jgi:hypothetical protein